MSNIYGNYLNLYFNDYNDDVICNNNNINNNNNNNNNNINNDLPSNNYSVTTTRNNELWVSNDFINHNIIINKNTSQHSNINDDINNNITASQPCLNTYHNGGGDEDDVVGSCGYTLMDDDAIGCFIVSLPDIHEQCSKQEYYYCAFPDMCSMGLKQYNKHFITKRSKCDTNLKILLQPSSLTSSLSSLSSLSSVSTPTSLKNCTNNMPIRGSHFPITPPSSSSSLLTPSLLPAHKLVFSTESDDKCFVKFQPNRINQTNHDRIDPIEIIPSTDLTTALLWHTKDRIIKQVVCDYSASSENDSKNSDVTSRDVIKSDVTTIENLEHGKDKSTDENNNAFSGDVLIDEIMLLKNMHDNMDLIQLTHQTAMNKLHFEKNKLMLDKERLNNMVNMIGRQQHMQQHTQQHTQQHNKTMQHTQQHSEQQPDSELLMSDDVKKKLRMIDDKLIEIDRMKRYEIERTTKKMNEEHDKMVSSITNKKQEQISDDLNSTTQTKSLPLSRSSSAKKKFFEEFDETFLKYKQGSIHVARHASAAMNQENNAKIHQDFKRTNSSKNSSLKNEVLTSDSNPIEHFEPPEETKEALTPLNQGIDPQFLLECIKRDAAHLIERPIRKNDFNLKLFIEQAGHNLSLHANIKVTKTCAMGPLYKISRKLKMALKRWYVLDRTRESFTCYRDESSRNAKDVILFEDIENVYIDDISTNCTKLFKWSFCVKTSNNVHHLVASSSYLRQIWIDILMTATNGFKDNS